MDWKQDTHKHIRRVRRLLRLFMVLLDARGSTHDLTKLQSPEAEVFEEFTPKLAGSTFGSDEYKGFLADMKPALDHHYECNRHHPEHFFDGVAGMNLVDLLEMFADWKAASERHEDGDIRRSIEINADRFGITNQLKAILLNTVVLLEGEENLDDSGAGG